MLAKFLRHAGIEPLIHIPDRLFEGYGPNTEAVRALAEKGARLLVTVDCGTTSIEPLAAAKALGLDVVVIDHHQADEALPPADALVNPNRLDDLSGLNHLAACGLVFMTVVAVNRELRKRGFWSEPRPEPDLLDLLDLVALGTVADVVPLKGLNRAFVSKGLLAMRRRESVGLTALMDAARLTGPPECWHLGFLLGPRINAGGRIGRADLGVRLLLEQDATEAGAMAAELDRLNRERQTIEQVTLAQAEAEAMAALGIEEKGAVVVTAGQGWHPGVVGLVAARLKERYGRPAFAIALEPGGIGTGSGRSITGVDIGAAVRHAVTTGLLVKGGGHAMAAGVTIAPDKLAAFRAYLEDTLADSVEAARRDDALLDRRRDHGGRRDGRAVRRHRARGPVRRRARGAGIRAAVTHDRLCRRGRAGACARAAARGRRHDDQRDRVPRRWQAARAGAAGKPRAQRPCGRHALDRSLERRGAGAVPADGFGDDRAGRGVSLQIFGFQSPFSSRSAITRSARACTRERAAASLSP